MEKTAVDFIVDEILKLNVSSNAKQYIIRVVKKKAKEMEKQQIIDAGIDCFARAHSEMLDGISLQESDAKPTAEQHYNETFGELKL